MVCGEQRDSSDNSLQVSILWALCDAIVRQFTRTSTKYTTYENCRNFSFNTIVGNLKQYHLSFFCSLTFYGRLEKRTVHLCSYMLYC